MEKLNINNFIRGWIVGDFEPSLHKANYEVGIKKYKAGDYEEAHYHKQATEITAIISGIVEMNNIRYHADDIIYIYPFEKTDFRCIEDCVTVVIKTVSIKGDKFSD